MANIEYWDDLVDGAVHDLGTFRVRPTDMCAFHMAFDRAAPDSRPSGMYLIALLMRQIIDGYLLNAKGLGAAGVVDITWREDAPLNSDLTAEMQVETTRALNSRPGVGFATVRQTVRDTAGRTVIAWRAHQFSRIRGAEFQTPTRPARLQTVPDQISVDPKHIALGSHTFVRREVIAFATRFDPQPFHLDDDAARDSLFGALCASGWHTTAVWFR
ncbi:MAG: hypothetical protein AAFR23_09385, partial [Pseudomonadota bacterium]